MRSLLTRSLVVLVLLGTAVGATAAPATYAKSPSSANPAGCIPGPGCPVLVAMYPWHWPPPECRCPPDPYMDFLTLQGSNFTPGALVTTYVQDMATKTIVAKGQTLASAGAALAAAAKGGGSFSLDLRIRACKSPTLQAYAVDGATGRRSAMVPLRPCTG